MSKEPNIYDLSRAWFDFCFDNPERIKPNHTAVIFFAIEHCNRLGWKRKFGFPTSMAMEAVGIKSYNTYINTLTDLVDWGFIEMIQKSKNQYSSNIIALSKNNKALDKALDKALMKHTSKQSESTGESIDSINKQIYNSTNTQIHKEEVLSFNPLKDLHPVIGFKPEYSKKEFLEEWRTQKNLVSKQKCLTNYLAPAEISTLKNICDSYTPEIIKLGMIRLFKQKVFPNDMTVMSISPKHFLNNINNYIGAQNAEIYGKKTYQ